MPAVPCHLNLKPNVCAICAVPLVGADCLCYLCRVICVWANCLCHLCCVCTKCLCRLCRVCGQSSGQLSVARLHVSARRAEIPANINCCCYDCCGSLNVDMVVVWAVVDVFCEPTVCATTGGTDSWSTKTSTTAHKNCGSLNVDMVVVWAVVDVFVGQLSVPPQVAQTVAPQRH